MINPSEQKIEVLKYFSSELDTDEVRSMILPEIKNIHELLAIVDDCNDQEKIAIFYKNLPFGPLAAFLNRLKKILSSENPEQISDFLEEFKFETLDISPTDPRMSLKQLIAELEVWNYMFYELSSNLKSRQLQALMRSEAKTLGFLKNGLNQQL